MQGNVVINHGKISPKQNILSYLAHKVQKITMIHNRTKINVPNPTTRPMNQGSTTTML